MKIGTRQQALAKSQKISARRKNSARNSMSKEIFCLALSAMLLALSFLAEAQQAKKVARIGYRRLRTQSSEVAAQPKHVMAKERAKKGRGQG
jgi:hypothetical protein